MTQYDTIDYDVLVIGAGGAGLRAAVEAAAHGVTVGLICKSLLGKAHTVMAEGGVAAALGNVDSRDNWKIHFRDTMRGGKFLNQWRIAEHHAQQAPETGLSQKGPPCFRRLERHRRAAGRRTGGQGSARGRGT